MFSQTQFVLLRRSRGECCNAIRSAIALCGPCTSVCLRFERFKPYTNQYWYAVSRPLPNPAQVHPQNLSFNWEFSSQNPISTILEGSRKNVFNNVFLVWVVLEAKMWYLLIHHLKIPYMDWVDESENRQTQCWNLLMLRNVLQTKKTLLKTFFLKPPRIVLIGFWLENSQLKDRFWGWTWSSDLWTLL